MLANLANVDAELCAAGWRPPSGKPAPKGKPAEDASPPRPALSLQSRSTRRRSRAGSSASSPAMASTASGSSAVRRALEAAGARSWSSPPTAGPITGDDGPARGHQERCSPPSRSSTTPWSWPAGPSAEAWPRTPTSPSTWARPSATTRPIAAWGEGTDGPGGLWHRRRCPRGGDGRRSASRTFAADLIEAIGWHRHWDRV